MGLPFVTSEGGYILGRFFLGSTVLNVLIYTIYRDPEIWGGDIEASRSERWFELDQAWIQEMLFPFSHGSRSVKLCSLHAWISLTKMIIVKYGACGKEHCDHDTSDLHCYHLPPLCIRTR